MDVATIEPKYATALGWTILFGSIYSMILLGIYNRKYPAQGEKLSSALAQRSWTGRQVGLLLASFACLMILLPLLNALAGGGDSALAQFIIVLLFSTILISLVIFISRRRKKNWSSDFGMSAHRLTLLPFTLAIYLAMLPVLGIASMLYNRLLESVFGIEVDMQEVAQMIAASNSWLKLGLILLAVLVAPFYEELIFRGVFFPYLLRRIGFLPAMVVVSIAFAGIHFHIPSLLPLFLLSIVLCLAYWRTGTLWISIGLHALFNSVSILYLSLGG